MDRSISSLLNEMSPKDCIQNFMRNKLVEDPKRMNTKVLQYFIDLMGCSYQIEEEVFDANYVTSDLAWKVYISKMDPNVEFTNTACFISLLVDQVSKSKTLGSYLCKCLDFLMVYSTHEMIPKTSLSVGVALQLISYHLQPLVSCLLILKQDLFMPCSSTDFDDSLDNNANENINFLTSYIKTIGQFIIQGLNIDPDPMALREEIALQFTTVVEENIETFILGRNWNLLIIYRELFTSTNIQLLIFGIDSFKQLFENENLHESLLSFFELEKKDVCESAKNILQSRLDDSDHQVKTVISRFLFYIESLKNEHLNKSRTLVSNVTNWNELISDMKKSGESFLPQLIRKLEEINATDEMMQTLITKFLIGKELMLYSKLLKYIQDNIDSKRSLALRAAQMLKITVNLTNFSCIVTRSFLKVLTICSKDEEIICPVLTMFTYASSIVSTDNDVNQIFISLLSEMFSNYNDPILLGKVMLTFDKIGAIEKVKTLNTIFTSLYESFLQRMVDKEINNTNPNCSTTILKMILILENNNFDFMDYFQYEALTIINTSHFNDENDPMFPYYVRLQKCLLLRMTKNIVTNKNNPQLKIAVPYDLTFIGHSVIASVEKLMTFMYRRDLNLFDAQFVFTCLIDLLHLFKIPPTIVKSQEKTKLKLFFMNNPQVTTENMKAIVDFVEHYVFLIEGKQNEPEHQENILLALVQLVQKYSSLPILGLSKIVGNLNSEFVDEVWDLLQVLFKKKQHFASIVGRAILEKSNEDITELMTEVKEFLKLSEEGNNREKSMKWKICAYLLDNMKTHHNQVNILEGIQLLSSDIEPIDLVKLKKNVQANLFEDSKEVLENFMDFLSN